MNKSQMTFVGFFPSLNFVTLITVATRIRITSVNFYGCRILFFLQHKCWVHIAREKWLFLEKFDEQISFPKFLSDHLSNIIVKEVENRFPFLSFLSVILFSNLVYRIQNSSSNLSTFFKNFILTLCCIKF